MLYSYKGSEPKPLPFSIRIDDGRTFTSLSELSDEDLYILGFSGPYTLPTYDEDTQKVIWNGVEFIVTNLSEDEIERKNVDKLLDKIKNLDSLELLSSLKKTLLFKKIKELSETSISIGKVYSSILNEFVNSIDDVVSLTEIDTQIKTSAFLIEFTDEEKSDFENMISSFGLDFIIKLPDQKYFDTHVYDSTLNKVLIKSPHKGWVWDDNLGVWQPPIQYPTDGNTYIWDDADTNWKLTI